MKRRLVFVSHSSHTKKAKRFTNSVMRALNECGYEAFVHWHSIKQDQAWRAEVDKALTACDGAVLLVSADALRSNYTHYEVLELDRRKKSEGDSFHLFAICLDHVTENMTDKRFAPARISDYQMQRYKTPGPRTVQRVAGEIAAEVRALINPARTPREVRAARLEDPVRDADPDKTRDALESLGLPAPPIAAHGRGMQREILQLLLTLSSAELKASRLALLALSAGMTQKTHKTLLLDVAAMSFVDDESAQSLSDKFKLALKEPETNLEDQPSDRRAIGIVAEGEVLAQLCAKAGALLNINGFDYFAVCTVPHVISSENSQESARELEAAIERGLLEGNGHSGDPGDARQRVREFLEERVLIEQPVFVALYAEGLDDMLLDRLTLRFPGVVFLLLTKHAKWHADWLRQKLIPVAPHCSWAVDPAQSAIFEAELNRYYNALKKSMKLI